MNTTINPFTGLAPETEQSLAADDHFPHAGHWWSRNEIDALIFAHASRRPLLVRGEAGSGKSQVARAAASVMNNARLLVEVIHPRFDALDLLYRVNSLERLADAQLKEEFDRSNRKYVKPGRLWQAMNYLRQNDGAAVLLIDEIDKADSDVPNALLEVLGNRSFAVPPLGDLVVHASNDRLPLIVLTTNEERELPAAFVRRCAVLNLNPPESETEFCRWLVRRGTVHRHLNIEANIQEQCARQVWADRQAAIAAGYPQVGLAEYVDLLTALDDLTRGVEGAAQRKDQQAAWLEKLSQYALVKHAGQDQGRATVGTQPGNLASS